MIFFPTAKINIGLFVLNKRQDGYHNIESIIYPLSLADILEVRVSNNIHGIFRTSGSKVPGTKKNNLCYRAYQLLRKQYDIPEADIHLHKVIPPGAGLGGGSSDGAFTLKAFNQIFNLKLTEGELKSLAEQLGSDCPFFIENKPSYAWERGNKLKPTQLSLKGYYILLVIPDIQVDTRNAYRRIVPVEKKRSLQHIVQSEPIENWNNLVVNDFEKDLLSRHNELQRIRQMLIQCGALFTSISGSGSAIYGIFKNEPNVLQELKKHKTWVEQFSC